MANSEYIKSGGGTFANVVALDAPMNYLDTIINYTRFRFSREDPVKAGMAVMIGDEIMRIEAVEPFRITVKRGCADTLPSTHPVDALVWLFDVSSLGTDKKERSAGETIGVKVSPFTIGGGGLPTASVKPIAVEFNWRYFRPYPPAGLKANTERWFVTAVINDVSPSLNLTWAHRDRVLQADQLVGHDDASVGPEPGVSYTLRIYDPVTDAVVRTEVGIVGSAFNYQRPQALYDQGYPVEAVTAQYTLTARRDGFDSWQAYAGEFTVHPTLNIESNYMAFAQRVIEAPYAINVRKAVTNPTGDFALAVAARPSDRMADKYELIGSGVVAAAPQNFTPWITLDFRLPELETTLNVRSSSFFDGVTLDGVAASQLALIEDEIVEITQIGEKQFTVKRGCLDTVPAVHIAGTRVWFFDAASSFDALERTDGETITYLARPKVYGPPVDIGTLPANPITFGRRAELPYPPGQLVVNGRPWFEEAQALAGLGTIFLWARRNRLTLGSDTGAHAEPDMPPELNQITRLRFYYETPSPTPGEPAIVNVLREIDEPGVVMTYQYAHAQADGVIAGTALGVCGTVVIYCRIFAMRDGLASLQSYVVPIRVPSYPC